VWLPEKCRSVSCETVAGLVKLRQCIKHEMLMDAHFLDTKGA
jgi:hypothetical protein